VRISGPVRGEKAYGAGKGLGREMAGDFDIEFQDTQISAQKHLHIIQQTRGRGWNVRQMQKASFVVRSFSIIWGFNRKWLLLRMATIIIELPEQFMLLRRKATIPFVYNEIPPETSTFMQIKRLKILIINTLLVSWSILERWVPHLQ
jgi:hypothetical protein